MTTVFQTSTNREKSFVVKFRAISPLEELLAFEALRDQPGSSSNSILKELNDYPNCSLSAFVDSQTIDNYKRELLPIITVLPNFGVRIYGDADFPPSLRDIHPPTKIFYYQGDWELAHLPSVAVVGTRHPTETGIRRTEYLVKKLVEDKFVIVSGLARGIDTAAHKTAISQGGNTIAVIGTPLNYYYPPENRFLQEQIAKDYLLISQVPFSKYSKQTYRENRFFFPERNITMSALSQATIIVEAGETSGTLVQARAALKQGRKLFILENNFMNSQLTWPKKFQDRGAIRVKDYDEIRQHLSIVS